MTHLHPIERMTYKSKLSKPDLIYALKETKYYKAHTLGSIGSDGQFKIQRVINYQNSCLPIIEGTMLDDFGGGTKVEVTIKPPIALLIIMASSVIFFPFLITLFPQAFADQFDEKVIRAFVIVSFLVGIIFMYGLYKYETNRSKKELASLFQATIQE